jgi:hypothetical protein
MVGRIFPEGALAAEDLARKPRVRYSICTIVTKPIEYARMAAGFRAGGFGLADCEYLYADNSAGNRFDAYAAYNLFFCAAAGSYLILCHQDVELLEDRRARLDAVIAELDALDAHWGLFGNAGGARFGKLAIRISGPKFDNVAQNGPFPVRCHSLDENFIVVRRDANLSLPRDRSGFHFYGTELCLFAEMLGWNAYVVDFHLYHYGVGELDATFLRQLNLLVEKYRSILRPRWISTPCTDVFLSAWWLSNVLGNRKRPLQFARHVARLVASWRGAKLDKARVDRHKSETIGSATPF